jgi:hypothetical protein
MKRSGMHELYELDSRLSGFAGHRIACRRMKAEVNREMSASKKTVSPSEFFEVLEKTAYPFTVLNGNYQTSYPASSWTGFFYLNK